MTHIQSLSTFSRTVKDFGYKELAGGKINLLLNQIYYRDIRVTEL